MVLREFVAAVRSYGVDEPVQVLINGGGSHYMYRDLLGIDRQGSGNEIIYTNRMVRRLVAWALIGRITGTHRPGAAGAGSAAQRRHAMRLLAAAPEGWVGHGRRPGLVVVGGTCRHVPQHMRRGDTGTRVASLTGSVRSHPQSVTDKTDPTDAAAVTSVLGKLTVGLDCLAHRTAASGAAVLENPYPRLVPCDPRLHHRREQVAELAFGETHCVGQVTASDGIAGIVLD